MLSELFFPEGLVGCAEWRHFALEQSPETAPLALLHSRDQPGLSLIVVDPRLVEPDYAPALEEADRAALGGGDGADLQWLSVLTVQNDPLVVTANLLGPLVVNRATGTARQVILSLSGYPAAYPVR
ncbi:MAG: flagellar assembly protein FliW [Chloroflexi bacterium]|nr:flagellar assembly protein FliW [Chloroflexota bacterium]